MGRRWNDGYSADVEIHLIVDNVKYEVAQVSGRMLFVRDPCTVAPSTSAELVIRVDGREEVEHILLTTGVEQQTRVGEFI